VKEEKRQRYVKIKKKRMNIERDKTATRQLGGWMD
jgi:hypothetical protein